MVGGVLVVALVACKPERAASPEVGSGSAASCFANMQRLGTPISWPEPTAVGVVWSEAGERRLLGPREDHPRDPTAAETAYLDQFLAVSWRCEDDGCGPHDGAEMIVLAQGSFEQVLAHGVGEVEITASFGPTIYWVTVAELDNRSGVFAYDRRDSSTTQLTTGWTTPVGRDATRLVLADEQRLFSVDLASAKISRLATIEGEWVDGAIDSTNVYWAARTPDSYDSLIRWAPLSGGEARFLTRARWPKALSAEGGVAYWRDAEDVLWEGDVASRRRLSAGCGDVMWTHPIAGGLLVLERVGGSNTLWRLALR